MNRNVKLLSRRLYSPSLKHVGWIEDAQLFLLIFHTFVCNFFPVPPLLPSPCQICATDPPINVSLHSQQWMDSETSLDRQWTKLDGQWTNPHMCKQHSLTGLNLFL